jgi:murein DD-endopeptidase MepM/ murein hydrolase activator NlpD
LRVQAHPTRRHLVRRVAAIALGIPVFAGIYLGAAGRRLASARGMALIGLLLIVGIGASQLGDRQAVATPSSPLRTFPPSPFKPIADPASSSYPTSQMADGGLLEGRDPALRRARSQPEAPVVVRFRPRPRQTDISRFAALSVRFTQPMDHASTQRAFTASVAGKPIMGDYVWAESDTVLVLIPSHPFRHSASVRLAVSRGARSATGVALKTTRSATFTVVAKPTQTSSSSAPRAPTPRASAWQWPLFGPITQYFGQHLTKYGFHQGIDIDGDTGDPVVAAHSGRVVVAGYADSCGGLQVRIDLGNGLLTWYRHLSRINVRVGARVIAGALIGRVGATGCAIGSHLHFGVSRDGTFVDPLRYLPRR